jgi:hypothetical protein
VVLDPIAHLIKKKEKKKKKKKKKEKKYYVSVSLEEELGVLQRHGRRERFLMAISGTNHIVNIAHITRSERQIPDGRVLFRLKP